MEIKNYDHIIPSEDFDIVFIEKNTIMKIL